MKGEATTWIERQAAQRPHGEALRWQGRSLDWRELDGRAIDLALRLESVLGVAARRVAVLAAPSPRVIELLHAAQRASVTLVPLPPRATDAEIERLVRHVEPSLLVHDDAATAQADRVAGKLGIRPCGLEGEIDAIAARGRPHAPASPHHVLLLVHTSGTTGVPKAVGLTNLQLEAAARGVLAHLGCAPGERWLAAMPMHHVGGLSIVVRAAIGGLSILLQPGFAAGAVACSLAGEEVAYVSLVPAMLAMLLEHETTAGAPARLRAAVLGGGRLPPALVQRAAARGWPLVATYGMTETAAQVTASRPGDAPAHPGSAGHPLPGVEIAIHGADATGIGEILVRGAQVFQGYHRAAEIGAGPLRDGWLHTGDLGRIDGDGRLWVETRRTDLIVTGGENVHPEEVEEVLTAHPGIAEAAVFAIEDERWGQRVAAAIVARGSAPDDGDVRAWCRERLARFKVPRQILRLAELPRTASGKIERYRLRDLVRVDSDDGDARV